MAGILQGSSGNDEIQTPRWLFDRLDRAFRFNLDAFASPDNRLVSRIGGRFSTPEGTFQLLDEHSHPDPVAPGEIRPARISTADGFEYPWDGASVFANPPYSMLMRAVAKFEAEVESAAWIAMLVKWDTSTKWAQRLEECAIVQPLRRRVPYVHPNPPKGWSGASFPSAIAFPRRDWVAAR